MSDRAEQGREARPEEPFANPGYSDRDRSEAELGHASVARKTGEGEKPKAKRPGPGYVASIFWLIVGAAVVVVGLFVGVIPQIVLNAHSATTTAVVSGHRTYHDSGKTSCGGTAYYPVVSFTTAGGTRASATLTNNHLCTAPSDGATFHIRYDTTNPSNAEIESAQNWTVPLVTIAAGLFFVLIALGMLRSTRKARRASAPQEDTTAAGTGDSGARGRDRGVQSR
jgi:hypothetical protein